MVQRHVTGFGHSLTHLHFIIKEPLHILWRSVVLNYTPNYAKANPILPSSVFFFFFLFFFLLLFQGSQRGV